MLKLLTYNIICGCELLQGYGKEIKNLKLFFRILLKMETEPSNRG
jgi:hypothetical protein